MNQIKTMNGVLLLDKPVGITSNAALQMAKKLYRAKKAGHTGSLDPLASGMLPICFGQTTKFSQFLLNADKSYLVTAKLGVTTTTGDAEGEITNQIAQINVTQPQIEQMLTQFRGEVVQTPSMYSAIKHQGQPLYKLARKGITVDREPRTINIYQLQMIDLVDDLLTMQINCSKGTYIRTLVEDIGKVLECGAHVISLRRLTVASYKTEQMISLEKLQETANLESNLELERYLLPVSSMLVGLPRVTISEAGWYYLQRGQAIIIPEMATEGYSCLVRQDGSFVGVGKILPDGKLAPCKLCNMALNV